MRKIVVVSGLFCLACSSSLAATTSDTENRAEALAASFRCLICEGDKSLLDEDNDLTLSMRELIVERIAAGESDEGIRTYFKDRYGSAILMEPRKT